MASKPATPGTGFVAPLYLLDKDGDVVGVVNSNGGSSIPAFTITALGDTTLVDQAANITTNLTDIKAALDAITARLQ